jgi:hypothetical protein
MFMLRFGYEPVQEIDVVGLKPPEALCNSHMNVFRLIPNLAAPFGRYMVSKFCGQEDLLSKYAMSLALFAICCAKNAQPYLLPLACLLKPSPK